MCSKVKRLGHVKVLLERIPPRKKLKIQERQLFRERMGHGAPVTYHHTEHFPYTFNIYSLNPSVVSHNYANFLHSTYHSL